MKYFLKLNIVSFLYALMIFIPLKLMLNVYRISRITNWEISTVNILTGITIIVEILGGTILFYFLTNKWLGDRKSTRLNSSHVAISYAVFCLKKKIERWIPQLKKVASRNTLAVSRT